MFLLQKRKIILESSPRDALWCGAVAFVKAVFGSLPCSYSFWVDSPWTLVLSTVTRHSSTASLSDVPPHQIVTSDTCKVTKNITLDARAADTVTHPQHHESTAEQRRKVCLSLIHLMREGQLIFIFWSGGDFPGELNKQKPFPFKAVAERQNENFPLWAGKLIPLMDWSLSDILYRNDTKRLFLNFQHKCSMNIFIGKRHCACV